MLRVILLLIEFREDLVPRKDMAEMWANRIAELCAGLQAFILRLPPMLHGKSQKDMRLVIDAEVWRLRDDFARKGRYCPNVKGTTKGKK